MQERALKYHAINLKDYLLIDIREKEDYLNFHIQNATWVQDITKITELCQNNPDKKILLYCYHGNTARFYTEHLIQAGYKNIYYLKENYEEFEELKIPLEYSKKS
ncbi:rhodanese-like domain-containing protein [Helicobacter anatolicus]|uniref:rhodanese-like domain-containing protein n=1 Tax=Helicobacter anatolicus TaxID=2905874 RepID=UPI001E529266|nr:rhodanese-like domain-containing protein [Helicobacter anatolicus]MCE3037163.1 rhodanese-like domain-containing protein [Helicobacter anatolicus]MCE3038633.1 rhodanese-like domain-containing protein [Helicobacter anatolicus]MCE3040354.1 rhodanese-like domain-containing protein [Helicobacter anatolicus]